MHRQLPTRSSELRNLTVVVTRPAGTAVSLVRRIRGLGGIPLRLPGLSLRAAADPAGSTAALLLALSTELLIFTSPAAVRFAAALVALQTSATVLAVGRGTALALRRHGVRTPVVPVRQDSEGLLELAALDKLQGRRVALIGAAGGRGLLRESLLARGANLHEVHVYRRGPARLNRRHVDAVRQLASSARVLLSSIEALENLCRLLPSDALICLQRATLVVSSERLAVAARGAGFQRITVAASALSADLLSAAAEPD